MSQFFITVFYGREVVVEKHILISTKKELARVAERMCQNYSKNPILQDLSLFSWAMFDDVESTSPVEASSNWNVE